ERGRRALAHGRARSGSGHATRSCRYRAALPSACWPQDAAAPGPPAECPLSSPPSPAPECRHSSHLVLVAVRLLIPDGATGKLQEHVIEAGPVQCDGGHRHGHLAHQPGHEASAVIDLDTDAAPVHDRVQLEGSTDLIGGGAHLASADCDNVAAYHRLE